MHIKRIERVQRKFVKYVVQGLGWTVMYDLPQYVNQCALICLETMSLVNVIFPRYHTRGGVFLRFLTHFNDAVWHLNDAVHHFNEFAVLFHFHLSRNLLFNRLR
jgi:hypothetical protein